MSNPQRENGFSGISNELLTEIYKRKFNGSQFSIILCVVRWTYGFQRKSHQMSDSFISKDTLMTAKLVNRELGVLIKSNVITVYKKGTYTTAREIGLNKDYDLWTVEKRLTETTTTQIEGTVQLEGSIESEGTPQIEEGSTPRSVDKVPPNQRDKKEIINKDNKEIYINNKPVYELYETLNFGFINGANMKIINEDIEIHGVENVEAAMKKTAMKNINNWNYVQSILKGMNKGGISNEPGINNKKNTGTSKGKWSGYKPKEIDYGECDFSDPDIM